MPRPELTRRAVADPYCAFRPNGEPIGILDSEVHVSGPHYLRTFRVRRRMSYSGAWGARGPIMVRHRIDGTEGGRSVKGRCTVAYNAELGEYFNG